MSIIQVCECGHLPTDCSPNRCKKELHKMEQSVKLGDKLKQTIDAFHVAGVFEVEAQSKSDLKQIEEDRKDLIRFSNEMLEFFRKEILWSRVPLFEIKDGKYLSWIKNGLQQVRSGAHLDIYQEFINDKLSSESLQLIRISRSEPDEKGTLKEFVSVKPIFKPKALYREKIT